MNCVNESEFFKSNKIADLKSSLNSILNQIQKNDTIDNNNNEKKNTEYIHDNNIKCENSVNIMQSDRYNKIPLDSIVKILETNPANSIPHDSLFDYIMNDFKNRNRFLNFIDINGINEEQQDRLFKEITANKSLLLQSFITNSKFFCDYFLKIVEELILVKKNNNHTCPIDLLYQYIEGQDLLIDELMKVNHSLNKEIKILEKDKKRLNQTNQEQEKQITRLTMEVHQKEETKIKKHINSLLFFNKYGINGLNSSRNGIVIYLHWNSIHFACLDDNMEIVKDICNNYPSQLNSRTISFSAFGIYRLFIRKRKIVINGIFHYLVNNHLFIELFLFYFIQN
ncbi:hypothetical protein TRFO_38093 [Tritrichomonas foetus]|uniref:Uncharacterized protein n=1 Tax=Tritrichomonas foetus TaxID=1144522 RepID=A0A1J4JBZ1_9EUKA|nr:hypothetical protein TRFO_38093 [Tritrichomonas foetus]|eukprot:OHS95767.1 hypothetical protein TRFO_38093 [Tritrichomonas foetus]